MLYDANLESLKRCVRNNEAAPDFRLDTWFSGCGTYGCLVGNDRIKLEGKQTSHFIQWAKQQYGTSTLFTSFLFDFYDCERGPNGLMTRHYGSARELGIVEGDNRDAFDRDAALNRLRKFINYVERKRAIWYEADGRVSERARRTSGDLGICKQVIESLAVAV